MNLRDEAIKAIRESMEDAVRRGAAAVGIVLPANNPTLLADFEIAAALDGLLGWLQENADTTLQGLDGDAVALEDATVEDLIARLSLLPSADDVLGLLSEDSDGPQ